MPVRFLPAARLVVTLLLLSPPLMVSAAFAQGAADAPARPISPGSIALLVDQANDAAFQARVKEALIDSRPEVRAVAARVLLATSSRARVPDLLEALSREQDAVAAGEMVRGVMTLGGADAYAPALAAARRLSGGHVAGIVVETFARLGDRALLAQVPALLAAAADRSDLAKAVMVVTKGDAAAQAQSLRDPAVLQDPRAIDAWLRELNAAGAPLPVDLFATWLQGTPELRVQAIWRLVARVDRRPSPLSPPGPAPSGTATPGPVTLPDEIVRLLEPMTAATSTQVSWEALGLELLARYRGQKETPRRWTTLPGAQRPLASGRLSHRSLVGVELLSDRERGDVSEALFGERDVLGPPRQVKDAGTPPAGLVPLRTVPPFAGALWEDLAVVTGCKPAANVLAAAVATYLPQGRPRNLKLDAQALSPACDTMARVLFSLTLAPDAEPVPSDYSEILLTPLTPAVVACASERSVMSTPVPPGFESAAGRIAAPKKLVDVRPSYPVSAQKERKSGMVIIEAIIRESGCVASAKVVRGIDMRLDAAAALAVSEWRYTPTLLNGKPVPVIMTVTVNFALR